MSMEMLPAVTAIQEPSLQPVAMALQTGAQATGGFGHLVSTGLEQVSQQLQATQVDLQRLASGDMSNLHHVMIRLEENKLAFQLMLQVRNRLLESYQEVMRMQV